MRPAPAPRTLRFLALLALGLAACGPTDDTYPRLLPLSELNHPPAIPAHAADAAADPQAVGAALQARREEAAARADDARGAVTDADALAGRAGALRRRADALAATELPRDPAPAAARESAPAPDPATAARARALRDRARALSDNPVAGDLAPLPPCPPGTVDAAASRCNPLSGSPDPRAP